MDAPATGWWTIALASPKSRIFGPWPVRKMFAGLISRWMMPDVCAASSAPVRAVAISTNSPSSSGPRASRRCSVSPCSSSITRNDTLSVAAPTSWIVQIFGCWSAATARASRSNRARRSGSAATSGGSTLTATVRSSRVSRAV